MPLLRLFGRKGCIMSFIQRMLTVVGALALSVSALVTSASSASASVSDCHVGVFSEYNEAIGYCDTGWGAYRVAALCNAPSPPYQITIYGSWQLRRFGQENSPTS